jgi:hypothetical protein
MMNRALTLAAASAILTAKWVNLSLEFYQCGGSYLVFRKDVSVSDAERNFPDDATCMGRSGDGKNAQRG